MSDDPEPTDLHHWEVYGFGSASRARGATTGDAGFDINYGAAKDLQLTLVLPLSYERQDGVLRAGLGDVELAAKYKFIHQRPGSLVPDVALFPRLVLPTAGRRFGSGRASLFLPLWAQKDWGKWSVFGGGGYDINPGPGNRNFWLSGLAVTRAVTDRLSLGAEVYHQTADADDARDATGLNLGLGYRVTPHWALLLSGGPGLQNAHEQGDWALYAALLATY